MIAATGNDKQSDPSTSSSVQCRQFKFREILKATNVFNESLVIGQGGFGKVYRGTIFNGSTTGVAAIKRLDPNSNQGAPEFWAEVEMLSKFRHCNLVSLFGYCKYEKEMILVYEYMPNGTLEDHLHKLGTPLSWIQLLNICIGAARGLHYLHTGTGIEVGVIHRDVKSSNILLHETWTAKISDFGLSKFGPTNQPSTGVETAVKGTFGYLDPDYYTTGKLTRKSDVYAFGVVLLEVLCRKRAVFDIDKETFNLAIWAQESIQEGKLKNIIDPDLRGQISPKCLKDFVRITKRCLHSSRKKRYTMNEVLYNLESLLDSQENFNNSVQAAGRTIFDRMVNYMLPFPSNGENTDIVGRQRRAKMFGKGESESTKSCHPSLPTDRCRHFSLEEVKIATYEFSEYRIIGKGGFGTVYKGYIDNATIIVAIKRLDASSKQGFLEFQTEIGMLSKLHHVQFVSLIGYCDDEGEMVLVYDYMDHGTLREHLYKTDNPPLSWKKRLNICIGAAKGLHYLHTCANRVIIHRDVKSTNILLDENWVAKVSDFGLSKLGPRDRADSQVNTMVKGTLGYMDPEYYNGQPLTEKSDVYSFGVLLLEVLCARPVINRVLPDEQINLAEWGKVNYQKGTLHEIIDSNLSGVISSKCLMNFGELAHNCLKGEGSKRPTMEEVVWQLEFALQLQEDADKTGDMVGVTTTCGKSTTDSSNEACDSETTFTQMLLPTGGQPK